MNHGLPEAHWRFFCGFQRVWSHGGHFLSSLLLGETLHPAMKKLHTRRWMTSREGLKIHPERKEMLGIICRFDGSPKKSSCHFCINFFFFCFIISANYHLCPACSRQNDCQHTIAGKSLAPCVSYIGNVLRNEKIDAEWCKKRAARLPRAALLTRSSCCATWSFTTRKEVFICCIDSGSTTRLAVWA